MPLAKTADFAEEQKTFLKSYLFICWQLMKSIIETPNSLW